MLDELTQKINVGAAEVQRQVGVPSPDQVRARARQGQMRSVAIAAGVSAGTVFVGVTALLSGGFGGNAPAGDPAGPSSGLVMLHEGEPGWQRNDDPAVRAAFSGCGASDPTLPGRTGAITMTGPGRAIEEKHSPTRLTEQVFFYDSERAAADAIAALRQSVTACGWIDPRMGQQLSGTLLTSGKVEHITGFQTEHVLTLVHSVTTGALMSSGASDLYAIQRHLCDTIRVCAPGATPSPSTGVPTGHRSNVPTGQAGK